VRFLPHGQKLSIALVTGDPAPAARLAARDVSRFDQRGCLSIHDIYLTDDAGISLSEFSALRAGEMERLDRLTPPARRSPNEAGLVASIREAARFQTAIEPGATGLWESANSTSWTVIRESSPLLKVSPLNRIVFVKPWPQSNPASALGPELAHLSTIALHPFDPSPPSALLTLGATRLCPLGETQNPSLFWHHDGLPPLASLVTWVDLG
jgi:hypothetical protein